MTDDNLFQSVGESGQLVPRVVDQIEGLILEGKLAPGVLLPTQSQLAEHLKVSRTVIREAIRILSARGLLEPKRGVGTVVRQVTRDQVAEPLSLLLRTQGKGVTYQQLHQTRTLLEVGIASIAAAQATDADRARLKEIMAEMEAARDNPKEFAVWDADFHQALAEATQNPLLAVFSGLVRSQLEEFITSVVPHIELEVEILPYHHRILESIEASDEAAARQAMEEHLANVQTVTERVFGKIPD